MTIFNIRFGHFHSLAGKQLSEEAQQKRGKDVCKHHRQGIGTKPSEKL